MDEEIKRRESKKEAISHDNKIKIAQQKGERKKGKGKGKEKYKIKIASVSCFLIYLQFFNAGQSTTFRDSRHGTPENMIPSVSGSFQYILQPFKCDSHNLGIGHCQQSTHWRNGPLLSQVKDLVWSTPRSGVTNRPGSLFLDVKFGTLEHFNQLGENLKRKQQGKRDDD